MATDLYAPCPCGSGKKFKWCCQAVHAPISRAFQLDHEGQHDAALTAMNEVVAQHPDNPEVWGRKVQSLFENGQPQEAEAALDKALGLNPQYAFGHFLKGKFRYYEGELPVVLILFRRAAELYDPEAHDLLAQIYVDVFDSEMKLNRPVAAHAAAELALRHRPTDDQLRQGLDSVFGPDNPNYPAVAKKAYQYKPLPAGAALPAPTGKLADAARAFGQLTAQDDSNAAAWYNLALTQTWLGNHPAALDALDRYVALEADDTQAAEAWALAEVLRLGQGMEDQADAVEYSHTAQLRDPQQFVGLLGELEREKVLAGVRVNQEEGVLTAVLLEEPAPATPELAARQSPRLAAYLVLMAGLVRVWGVVKESVDRAFDKLRQRAGGHMGEAFPTRGPAKFHDVLSEALTFPRNAVSQEDATARLREGFERFFEETWLHRPLKSLGGVPPIDAAGHAALRRKLVGVVQFLQECAALAQLPYDFDRLRHKLGLTGAAAPIAAPTGGSGRDIAAMNPADLAGLSIETLTEAELEQAFQTALKLDARELAGKFAGTLIERPAQADRPDRYPLYNHLIAQAQAARDLDAALGFVDAGERADCEANEGRRRNDYELRRGQLQAKRGDYDAARDVFDRLIARVPDDLRFRAAAAEAMLSAKQGPHAARYAQEGLEASNKQQNRDSAEHFKELLAAAQR